MKMQHYSTELYRKLGALTDYPMNYHVTGSVPGFAHSRQRMEEFAHVRSMAKQMGFDMGDDEQQGYARCLSFLGDA